MTAQSLPETGTPLTWRENEVLKRISYGMSNGEIGKDLSISEDTVKTHNRRLFRKLGARDRANAVRIGIEQGLISVGGQAGPPLVERFSAGCFAAGGCQHRGPA